MPFITNYSPEGKAFGEIERTRIEEERNKRKVKWEQSDKYVSFNSNEFVREINEYLAIKEEEYNRARAGFFGPIRGFLTRYNEKESFLNSTIEPILRDLSNNPENEALKKKLLVALRRGIDTFTLFKDESGLATLFENAVFALTDTTLNANSDFKLIKYREEVPVVVGVVVSERASRIPATGVVIPRDDSLFALRTVHVSKNPIVGVPVDQTHGNDVEEEKRSLCTA